MAIRTIDLNADLGEGVAWELSVLPLISSANIACGAHAGSPETTRISVASCLEHGIQIGAHPGYPDRESFGRRTFSELNFTAEALFESLTQQLSLIREASYIKPHGALYNESAQDADCAVSLVLIQLLCDAQLPLLGLPHTAHEQIADNAGVRFVKEGFIDRRYDSHHRLIPRSQPNSIIHEQQEAVDQALKLAATCDSLCVHGDNQQAVELLTIVRRALETEGYSIAPW